MSATLEELLAYEAAVEAAWVDVLTGAQLNAQQEFSVGVKKPPYVDVMLTNVMPTGHKFIAQSWGAATNGRSVELFDKWTGQVVCKIVTERGVNSDQQAPLLGKIRALAQRHYELLTMPHHSVEQFKEAGLNRGVTENELLDWSELRFTIHFGVSADAWPLTAPTA